MAVRLSALRAGRSLSPGKFLVLISVKLSRRQGHSAAGRIKFRNYLEMRTNLPALLYALQTDDNEGNVSLF
jgi:hypothetical protein